MCWVANRKMYFSLIILMEKDGDVHMRVNRGHANHDDSKSYSGSCATMGKGILINILKKLRLVTQS